MCTPCHSRLLIYLRQLWRTSGNFGFASSNFSFASSTFHFASGSFWIASSILLFFASGRVVVIYKKITTRQLEVWLRQGWCYNPATWHIDRGAEQSGAATTKKTNTHIHSSWIEFMGPYSGPYLLFWGMRIQTNFSHPLSNDFWICITFFPKCQDTNVP